MDLVTLKQFAEMLSYIAIAVTITRFIVIGFNKKQKSYPTSIILTIAILTIVILSVVNMSYKCGNATFKKTGELLTMKFGAEYKDGKLSSVIIVTSDFETYRLPYRKGMIQSQSDKFGIYMNCYPTTTLNYIMPRVRGERCDDSSMVVFGPPNIQEIILDE